MPRRKKVSDAIEFAKLQNCLCAPCIKLNAKNFKPCCRCLIRPRTCVSCLMCTNCAEDETHWKCPICRTLLCVKQRTGRCTTCNKCQNCDDCITCKVCHNRIASTPDLRSICPDCKICRNCGKCKHYIKLQFKKTRDAMDKFRQRASIADIILRDGTPVNRILVPFHTSKKTEFTRNSLRRFLSVEMEIAALESGKNPVTIQADTIEINKVVSKWRGKIVPDQSLPATGFEINTAPANGNLFIQQIEEICKVLADFKATVVNTFDARKRINCCGLHVHVDARDYSYADLKRFLRVYELVEPDLYLMLPGYRRASHFCQRCGERYGMLVRAKIPIPPDNNKKRPDAVKQGIISSIYGGKLVPDRSDKRSCPDESRYRAVNLHQYFYRGTIEFRHMYGTTDPHLITSWARLVGGLIDFASKTPDKAVFGGQPAGLLMRIAKQYELLDFVTQQIAAFADDLNEVESPVLGERAAFHNAPAVAAVLANPWRRL